MSESQTPEGAMVMVPVEPTEAMIAAAYKCYDGAGVSDHAEVWSAMIAATQQSPEGWQDISTAPKDGTLVMGCWLLPDRAPLFGVVSWGLEPDYDSWAGSEEGWLENDVCVAGVTHWRPLPAPPVPSVSDQGSSLRDTQPGSADGSSSNEGAGA